MASLLAVAAGTAAPAEPAKAWSAMTDVIASRVVQRPMRDRFTRTTLSVLPGWATVDPGGAAPAA